MENQPNQEPRKKQGEGESSEPNASSGHTPSKGNSLAGAVAAGAAAGAAGSVGAEFIKDLFSHSTTSEPTTPLSGVATQTAGEAVQEPEKTEEPGLASSIAQHITDVTEDKIPKPSSSHVTHSTVIQPELELEPVTADTPVEPSPQPVMPQDIPPPVDEPGIPTSPSAESVEFGGHRMELDINDDGKMDQVLWDVNQDSFVDVIGTDANQDNIITSDEVEIINDPATLQKPEEIADPSVLFVDFNQDNQPEAMLMDINSDQQADIVMQQGPPQIDYEGEVAGNIPEDVDPTAENEHRQDLSTLDDPFSDLNQWA